MSSHSQPSDGRFRLVSVRASLSRVMTIVLTSSLLWIAAPSTMANQDAQVSGLKIVVLEGEDGVNIIEQKTAVASLIEVRDGNDLPVAGATITFVLGAGSAKAALSNGLQQLTLTTNAAGRATVVLNPLSSGSVQINVSAAYQGQTAAATISQTNFATVAQAAQAANASGATSSASTGSSSGGAGASTGSAGAASAGSASGAAAAAGGAGAAGGISGTAIAVTAGAIAGGAVATKAVVDAVSGPSCTAQQTAVENGVNSLVNSLNTFEVCVNSARTLAARDACYATFSRAYQTFLSQVSDLCSCLGPDATSESSSEEKAAVRELFSLIRSLGFNLGSIPSCFQ